MSSETLVNIYNLMVEHNLEIDNEMIPQYLKCIRCKTLLKDACQVPCGCEFCRNCIDFMIENGDKFCPGPSEDCNKTSLSRAAPDYRANKMISKLVVKCPQNGCIHQCELINMEDHLRLCPGKKVECPFHEFGCKQEKTAVKEMNNHLQQENRGHYEILIGMIVNNNNEIKGYRREIEILKQNDDGNKKEIALLNRKAEFHRNELDILKQSDERYKREIDMLKRSDEGHRRDIKMLKHELLLKNGQINNLMGKYEAINEEIKFLKEENQSKRYDIKSVKDDIKAIIVKNQSNQTTTGKYKPVKDDIKSNQTTIDEYKPVKDDIKSNQTTIDEYKSIKEDIKSIKALVRLVEVDASCEFVIDVHLGKVTWGWGTRLSDYFSGYSHPYKYRLASWNGNRNTSDSLKIDLIIYPGPSDAQLRWPFRSTVVITVADKIKRELCQSISRQCLIERPRDNDKCSYSDAFIFPHLSLTGSGLDLGHGVRISCQIVSNVHKPFQSE